MQALIINQEERFFHKTKNKKMKNSGNNEGYERIRVKKTLDMSSTEKHLTMKKK